MRVPTNGGFIVVVVLAAIAGVFAVIVVPQFTGINEGPPRSKLQDQLQTIRSLIELYNVQNPATAYDEATPLVGFWDALLEGNHLAMVTAPKNALQDDSTLVVAESRNGAGWVWTEIRVSVPVPPEFAGAFTIYAIDENGNFYDWDEDGWPD